MKRLPLALALFLVSCGGGEQSTEGRISLSIKGEVKVEYFSRVFLRVSYPEGGPYQEERYGRFAPGDVLVFNVEIPEGRERTIEVFLFDPQNKPVYYRSLFLPELSKKDTINVELLPSEKSIQTFEIRSDGTIKTSAKLELLSEDLYSSNGLYDRYVVGRAIREGQRIFYVDALQDKVEVELERRQELVVSSQTPLYVTGSAEGFVRDSVQVSVSSSKLTTEGEGFLCAVDGNSIWYSLSKASTLELQRACVGSTCTAYTVNSPQDFTLAEVLILYKGIACVGGYLEAPNRVRVLDLPQTQKYLGFNYVSDQPCKTYGKLYTPINNVEFSKMFFEVPPLSSWRVYSEDRLYEMKTSCFASSGASFLLIPSYRGRLFVEKLEEGKAYGKFLDSRRWSWEGHDIKGVSIKDIGDLFLLSFELVGNFKSCDMRLWSEEGELHIKGIPTYRRHIKLSKALFGKPEDMNYELTCYFEGGYVKNKQEKEPVYGIYNPAM